MQFIKKHSFLLFLIGAVLISSLVCLLLAAQQQLWFDESYSVVVAKKSIGDIINLAAVDAHPPFYYLLLHFWGSLVGWNELGLRSLSIIFYAASIGLIILLISKLFSKKIAICAIPILILAPFIMRYGFEVRMYSLASLIVVGSAFALYYAMKTNQNRYWIIYGLLVALGVWTLYMTFIVFAAQFILLACYTLKNREKWLKQKWLLAYAGAVLLFLPWIPTAFHQMAGGALSGANVTFGISQLLNVFSFGLLYETSDKLEFLYWILILAILLATVLMARTTVKKKLVEPKNLYFLAAHFLLPLALFMIIASPIFGWEIYLERYLAQFIIFGYASFAVIYAANIFANKKPTYSAYAAAILIMLIGSANLFEAGNFNYQRLDRPRSQAIASELSKYCQQTIIVDDLYFYIEVAPYMAADCNYYFSSAGEVWYSGGYAPLHKSDRRVANATDIKTKQIAVLSRKDKIELKFDPHYKQVSHQDMDWRDVYVYER